MEKRYGCPVELTLDVVGGRWRTILLAHLKQGVHRYGELRRRVPGITEKMLSQRLRELEAEGLVVRRDRGGAAPHVEYELTDDGRSLTPVLQAMWDWGEARAAARGIDVSGKPVDPAADGG